MFTKAVSRTIRWISKGFKSARVSKLLKYLSMRNSALAEAATNTQVEFCGFMVYL